MKLRDVLPEGSRRFREPARAGHWIDQVATSHAPFFTSSTADAGFARSIRRSAISCTRSVTVLELLFYVSTMLSFSDVIGPRRIATMARCASGSLGSKQTGC